MNTPEPYTPYFARLIKTAYSLADALALTHEINVLYSRKKDLSIEEWVHSIRQLLSQIDHVVFKKCEILVFQTGLHNRLKHSEDPRTIQDASVAIPSQILDAANRFGDTICLNISEIKQLCEQEQNKRDCSNEIIDICKQVVNLILGELGLKTNDLARIY